MEFDKLTKTEKVEFWIEIESDIQHSINLCGDLISKDAVREINKYLAHNELGIALEGLTEEIIKEIIRISSEAKLQILSTFMKMDYHKDEKDQFHTYSELLGEI